MQAIAFWILLAAQEDLTVLKPEENPRKMVYQHLQAECRKHFEARRKAVASLKTPEDVRRRQEELRAKFVAALGGWPEKTPLNPRVTGRQRREGYSFEKVVYESRPGHHVTAVLYLPEGTPPFPGVLFPCGHSENGKASEAYQRACILLAKNGLAVLCYDPIGQGERKQLLNEAGKAAIQGSTTEHTMVGIGALLVGRSCASYRIWDGIRSLDYLAGRPEVDPSRLGCTGNSGGGTLTSYLMALDDRIRAAAPSCYLTTLEKLFDTIGPQDAEQNITGQVAFGIEHADYVTLRAPRATLMCVGTQDYFDIHGAWTSFREAKGVYGLLGHAERVDLFEFNDKHGFSQPRREAATRWLRRWLLEKNDPVFETPFPVEKDPDLQATTTGQVLSDLKGKSCFDLNAERERKLAPRRGKLGRDELLREVKRLIAVETPVPAAKVSRRDALKLVLEPEPGVLLPALSITPKGGADRLTVFANGEGKAAAQAKLGKWLEAGHAVLAVDLRGMGETSPQGARGERVGFFGHDWREFFLGLHLNRPLLGQRVRDLLSVLGVTGEAHVVAVGTAAPVALHAAALDPRVTELTLEGMVVSWSAVARATVTRNQLSSVVPGALEAYDLPDLAAALAPRKLTIRGATDPLGNPVSRAVLEEAYAAARAAYQTAGAEDKLVLEAK